MTLSGLPRVISFAAALCTGRNQQWLCSHLHAEVRQNPSRYQEQGRVPQIRMVSRKIPAPSCLVVYTGEGLSMYRIQPQALQLVQLCGWHGVNMNQTAAPVQGVGWGPHGPRAEAVRPIIPLHHWSYQVFLNPRPGVTCAHSIRAGILPASGHKWVHFQMEQDPAPL